MLPHCRRLQKIEHLEGGKGSCAEHYIAMLATALFCVSPCYVASMRSSLRQKYDIQVSFALDCQCSNFYCVHQQPVSRHAQSGHKQ